LAAEQQFKVVDVPADGNCALHAIAHQLSSQGLTVDHKSLWHQAVCYLRTRPRLLDERLLLCHKYSDVDSYLTQQARDGQWVDEMMMRVVIIRHVYTTKNHVITTFGLTGNSWQTGVVCKFVFVLYNHKIYELRLLCENQLNLHCGCMKHFKITHHITNLTTVNDRQLGFLYQYDVNTFSQSP